jgi:hypothetical protein
MIYLRAYVDVVLPENGGQAFLHFDERKDHFFFEVGP